MPSLFGRSKALVPVEEVPNVNAQLIEAWLHDKPRTTQDAYRRDITRFLAFLQDKPLQTVTLLDLQGFTDNLKACNLGLASQARTLKACKSILTFGGQLWPELFTKNAGVLIHPKVPTKLAQRILDEESVLRMIALEDDKRNHAILRLLYASAIRRSELIGLCWQDLQARASGGGYITVTGKGDKVRTILIKAGTWNEIAALRNGAPDSTSVFDLGASQIYRIVKAAAKRAGIDKPVSPHWMRHAHISHALDHGAPIHLVQATSGHANLAILSVYAHARPDDGSSNFLTI